MNSDRGSKTVRNSKLKLTLMAGLAAVVAPLAAHAAPRVIFTSGGTPASGASLSGEVVLGGSTQIRMDDGALIAFVGLARINIGGDGLLTILDGHATLVAGSGALQVRTPEGVITVNRGAAALQVADGRVTGRTLAGLMTVQSGDSQRRFGRGRAFAASAGGGIVAVVATEAQPVSAGRAPAPGGLIDQPASVLEVLQNAQILGAGLQAGRLPGTQNVALPVYPTGSGVAELLQQAFAERLGRGGFEFSAISEAALAAQLAYLKAGGTAGGLNGQIAAEALAAYLDNLKSGGVLDGYPGDLSLLRAYFDYLSAVGLPADLDAEVRQALLDYIAFIKAGGVFGASDGPAPSQPSNPGGPTPPPPPPPSTTGIGVGAGTTLVLSAAVSGLTAGGPSDPGTPKVILDGAGKPQDLGYYGKPSTATVVDFQAPDGYVVGRFAGGGFGSSTFAANDGVHFAVLTPTTDLPTSGSATYTAVSFTVPTVPGGGGDFTQADLQMTLGVAFSSKPTFGYEGELTGLEDGKAVDLKFASAGGSAAPSLNNSNIVDGAATLYGGKIPLTSASGPICGAGCKFTFNAISGGKGASAFGIGYAIIDGGTDKSILNGAAVLTRR